MRSLEAALLAPDSILGVEPVRGLVITAENARSFCSAGDRAEPVGQPGGWRNGLTTVTVP
jgi:hypothetical protein